MHSPDPVRPAAPGASTADRVARAGATPTATGPLAGIRVLDLSAVVLGPLATQTLGDLGADVIKIEGPEGELLRAGVPARNPGMNALFMNINRNKRSVSIDLKTPAGAAALRRLIEGADVLVHNMRVAAIERLGFGYDAVAAINPRIVYCVATGFGQDGPHRDKPAFDDIIQAACGLVGLSSIGRDRPDYVPTLIADKTVGLVLVNAVLAALLHRERHGRGQKVEVPMLETMAAFTLAEHMGGMTFQPQTDPSGYTRILGGGRVPVRTRDGYITLLPYTSKQWGAFFTGAGRPDLGELYGGMDPTERGRRILELYAKLGEIAPERDCDAWLALCESLDIPATRIYSLDELAHHPHLRAVGFFEDFEHPTEGRMRQVRPTTLFSATPANVHRPVPRIGEHTVEVLREAGLDDQAIAAAIGGADAASPQAGAAAAAGSGDVRG